MHSGFGPEFP